MRVDYVPELAYQTQYEFLLGYDAYTRTLSFAVYDAMGSVLASTTYILGATETFSLGKVGAAAWGLSGTSEPTIIATTDNLYFDASMARNGNFEVDGNSDEIPDNWQAWTGNVAGAGTRSSTRAKFGTYSHKLADSSSTGSYGLQTVRMSASPGRSYFASTWVYVESGRFDLYLEFYNAVSGGSRLAVGVRSSTASGQWEYLDVTMTAPAGTVAVDLLVYSMIGNTGTAYFDGAELRPQRSFWAIEVHGNNLPQVASWDRALGYVTDLGMSHIRIDFVWEQFEPNRDAIDWNHVAYWDGVVQMARARGLGIVAVLSKVPQWAELIRDCYDLPCAYSAYGAGDLNLFFQEWRAFTRFIASRYGQDIQYYQLLNEENHPSHEEFPHTHDGEPRAFYEAYQGLLEGTGLTAVAHKSRFKTIVNMFADLGGWDTHLTDILSDAWGDDSIDVIAIDHYPGTWCCGSNYRDWGTLDTLSVIARDPRYGKEMAVMETGFSSYSDFLGHGWDEQEAFVDQGMDEVLVKKNNYNGNYPLNSLLLVSWYEYIDLCSNCGGIIENHFGILTYNSSTGAWGEKGAYDNLRYQVSRWT